MRFLVIIGIIGGISFYAYHTFSTGKGIFAHSAGDGLGDFMSHPTSMISNNRKKAEGKTTDKREELEQIVNGHLAENARPGALVAGTPAGEQLQAVAAAPGVPAPQPAVSSGEEPKQEPMTISFQFVNRELPADPQIEQLRLLGCALVADRSSGTVVMSGPPNDVTRVLSILQSLDLTGQSCAVRTWAVYVDQRAQKGFDLVAALSAVAAVGESSFTIGNGAATLDLNVGDLTAALDVIADGSTVEVMQRPHVTLMHGLSATVESIQEVPLPSVALSQGISQSSVNYRKVGLQLTVTPYFLGHNTVRLAVKQSNGLLGASVDIGNGAMAPVIESQSVETTVQMTVGQSVVLGGVATDRIRTVRGILRDTTERVHGALYVILSTYYDVPKAIPVQSDVLPAPDGFPVPPFASSSEPPRDWIDGELLPAKGWEREEQELVRSKARK